MKMCLMKLNSSRRSACNIFKEKLIDDSLIITSKKKFIIIKKIFQINILPMHSLKKWQKPGYLEKEYFLQKKKKNIVFHIFKMGRLIILINMLLFYHYNPIFKFSFVRWIFIFNCILSQMDN